jgi:hypothetical protein
MLPLLARLRLPIPLGGTSNHSRAAALREVNGITTLVRDLADSTHLEAAELRKRTTRPACSSR